MLQRHRDELGRKWEEREKRLAAIRSEERGLEERAAKRRKVVGQHTATKTKQVNEDEEFLLADGSDDDGDPFSSFSKETRALMEKAGLAPSKANAEEEEEVEDNIKVRNDAQLQKVPCL